MLGAEALSSLDWVAMIRDGIPAAAVEPVLRVAHLSQRSLLRSFAYLRVRSHAGCANAY